MRAPAGLRPTVLVLLGPLAGAQLGSGGLPASALHPLPGEVPVVVLAPPDRDALLAEDEAALEPRPFRYGVPLAVELDAESGGRWDTLPGGELVWRARIASPGARSLGVHFARFRVPAGGRVFLYGPDRSRVLGAFTEANHLPGGGLSVQPLAGDELVIEYVQDAGTVGAPALSVGHVVHDYRDVFGLLDPDVPGGRAFLGGGCLVDVNCPDGDAYQDIKRSVVMLLTGGGNCSGVLLNNTAEDGTPYFYTANHCGDMTNAVVVFGYERDACGSGTGSQMQTLSGATLLRATAVQDSQLYVLSAAPPAAYEPFYAGWDRRGSPPGPAVNISHPAGNPKKIAVDQHDPVKSGFFWQVTWEAGLVLGGSSGSPLFNAHQRVIGTACCVNNFDCGLQTVSFGRLNAFWNNHDLSPWLDPLDLGVNRLDGHDPFLPVAIPVLGSGTNPLAYRSTSPPAVGSTWTAEVDASVLASATAAVLAGFSAPSSGMLFAFGELLVDPTSMLQFTSSATVAGGLSVHANAIPNNPALVGARSSTQAFLVGGGTVLATNGLQLRPR